MGPAAVIIVLNGAVVASAPPPRLLFGHVVVPLTPVVTRFTERVAIDGNTITLVRGAHTCVLHVGWDALQCDGTTSPLPVAPFGRDGVAYVPLAEIARAFGGTAAYDARSRILALTLPEPTVLASPAPFDPAAPQASPTTVFTPSPPPATPRPVDAGSPQPRRTAIPAQLESGVGDEHDPALGLGVVPPVGDPRFDVADAAQSVDVPADARRIRFRALEVRAQPLQLAARRRIVADRRVELVVGQVRSRWGGLIAHSRALLKAAARPPS